MRQPGSFFFFVMLALTVLAGPMAEPFALGQERPRQAEDSDGAQAPGALPRPTSRDPARVRAQQTQPSPPSAAIIKREQALQDKPRVMNAWARPAIAGGVTAVYATFLGGKEDDVLTGISTAWAGKASLHETVVDAKGIARMLPSLAGFSLEARQRMVLQPGGRHIMLQEMARSLRPGQMFPLVFNFQKAGAIRVMVKVSLAEPQVTTAMPAKPD